MIFNTYYLINQKILLIIVPITEIAVATLPVSVKFRAIQRRRGAQCSWRFGLLQPLSDG
jgi:NADH:ubiquinone oxidoreductase subunit H